MFASRLFSRAGFVLCDYRKKRSPSNFDREIILISNKFLQDMKTTNDIITKLQNCQSTQG